MNKILFLAFLMIGLLGCNPKTSEGTYNSWTLTDENVVGIVELKNPAGRAYYKISKISSESVKVEEFNSNGIVISTTTIAFQNSKLSSVSEANQWGYVNSTYKYNPQGSNQLFETGRSEGVNTNLPCKGKLLTYKNGLFIESKYVGFDGKDCECEEGYSIIKYERYNDKNRFGLTKSISYFGLKGENVVSKGNDYHMRKTERDERGNIIEESYFGIDEMPIKTRIGFHRMTKKYDANDNNTEIEYFDLGKNKIANIYGTSKIIYEFEEGKIKKMIRYNIKDEISVQTQSKISDGAAIVTYKYDGNGNDVLQSYYDADEMPMNTNKGYHSIQRKYDNKNRLTEYMYLDKDNKPFKDKYGVYRYYYVRDDFGRTTTVAYFDDKESPVKMNPNEVFMEKYNYDDEGRRASVSFWESETKKMVRWDNVHEEKYTFNDEGQLTELINLEIEGNLIKSLSGESRRIYTYDKFGRRETTQFFDSDSPTNLSNTEIEGYQKVQYFYDEQNRLEKIEYFDKNNKPVNVKVNSNKHPSVQKISFEYQGRSIVRQSWFEAGSNIPKKVIDCIENECMTTMGLSIGFINKR